MIQCIQTIIQIHTIQTITCQGLQVLSQLRLQHFIQVLFSCPYSLNLALYQKMFQVKKNIKSFSTTSPLKKSPVLVIKHFLAYNFYYVRVTETLQTSQF